jgi:hypothetical protein
MKKTNSKLFNDAFKAYLLPIVIQKAEDYGVNPLNPWQWVIDTAKDHIPHDFREGEQAGVASWLAGCALDIPVYNGHIRATAERLHECKLTDKQAEKVIDCWFNFHALKIMQYARES